ncbi:hypothetical protein ERO13_D10G203950v2 [Gossypium hirsutum]|nr:hypothetical protein ERO13_D10G203950v2 [Gossypium hirsutum]
MLRWVREEGSAIPISSSGNDTTSGHPFDIHRELREVSLCNPHSIIGLQILDPSILSDLRLVRILPPSGKDIVTFRQYFITSSSRELRLCTPSGRPCSSSQFARRSTLRFVGSKPLSGKQIKFEQLHMFTLWRCLSWFNPCGRSLII